MADKAISDLTAASEIVGTDLFVLEQAGTAKKLSGQTLTTFLLKLVEAHGGISSIAKTSTSGLVDTYTITMADQTTTKFTVTNGAKGDKGDNTYTWVKYSSAMPTKNSDMYDTPDNYMGIYTGSSSTAPASFSAYKWFQIKGEKGNTGDPAVVLSQSVWYQVSTSGTVIPDGAWLSEIPSVPQGQYLWTQSKLQFNSGKAQVSYSVTRFGIDGTGAVSTVAGKSPDSNGNVALAAADIGARPDSWMPSASDVGARPDSWTPSAADVGAIPNGSGAVGTTQLASGAVTAAKLASDAKSKGVSVTLTATGWSNKSKTVSVEGVTANNNVLVSAAPSSRAVYNDAEIYCSAQGNGTLTFTCSTVPTSSVVANVIILV